MSVTRIPLEVLRIDEPCIVDWSKMAGDERLRFCQGCQNSVHHLSEMTREEAERLVCESAGNLCVRMELLSNGQVVTVDYQHANLSRRQRGWRFWTGVGLLGAFLVGIGNAMNGWPFVSQTVMGGIRCPPTTLTTTSLGTMPSTSALAIPASQPAAVPSPPGETK